VHRLIRVGLGRRHGPGTVETRRIVHVPRVQQYQDRGEREGLERVRQPGKPGSQLYVQRDEPINRASQSLAMGLSVTTEPLRHKVTASISVL